MRFLPELKQFLLDHGEIYTVRKYKMVQNLVVIEGVGVYLRIPLGTVTKEEDLEPYVLLSGFPTTQAWWEKILTFIPRRWDVKYLYHVRREP